MQSLLFILFHYPTPINQTSLHSYAYPPLQVEAIFMLIMHWFIFYMMEYK